MTEIAPPSDGLWSSRPADANSRYPGSTWNSDDISLRNARIVVSTGAQMNSAGTVQGEVTDLPIRRGDEVLVHSFGVGHGDCTLIEVTSAGSVVFRMLY